MLSQKIKLDVDLKKSGATQNLPKGDTEAHFFFTPAHKDWLVSAVETH